MSLSKALAVGPLAIALAWPLGLGTAAVAWAQAKAEPRAEQAPIVKLSEQLRSPGSTGKWKEVGVDPGKSRISTVPRLKLDERAVPASYVGASAVPGGEPSASVDWRRLQGEVSQRFGDLEACRNKVARQGKVAVEDLRAGLVVLRWTILPSGRTAGSVVYQQRETELALLRCVRARMDAWRFTPASRDPIVIEQTYDFQAALAAARAQAPAAATPAAPARAPAAKKP
jgi:hypothetical protein